MLKKAHVVETLDSNLDFDAMNEAKQLDVQFYDGHH